MNREKLLAAETFSYNASAQRPDISVAFEVAAQLRHPAAVPETGFLRATLPFVVQSPPPMAIIEIELGQSA